MNATDLGIGNYFKYKDNIEIVYDNYFDLDEGV